MTMIPEDEPSGLVQIGSGSSEGSGGLDFSLLVDLLRGAAISTIRFSAETGNVSIRLAAGRVLIVKRLDSGFTLELDTFPRGNFSPPVPLIFPRSTNYEISNTAKILTSIANIYAIVYLIITNRDGELQERLSANFNEDLVNLLGPDERVEFYGVCRGSWYGELWTKSKKGLGVLKTICMSASKEGREVIRRRYEAETQIKEAEADSAWTKARAEKARARQDELNAIKILVDFYDEKIASRPKEDPVRKRFEKEVLRIEETAKTNLLEDRTYE